MWHIFGSSIGTFLNIFEQKSGRYCSERLFPIVPVVFPTVLRKEIDILYLFVSLWRPGNHTILTWSLFQGIKPTRRCWIIFKGNKNGAGWKLLEQRSTLDNGWPWKLDQWVFLFLSIAFYIRHLCFKMIFLMMIQLVTGQWWPTVEHPAKNKENVQWNESERNKSSSKFNQSKKLFQKEINFWTKINLRIYS